MLQHSVFRPKEKIKRYDLVYFCKQSLQNWTEKDCCYLPANHMWNTGREDLPQADLQRCSDEADHRLIQESLQVKPKRSFYLSWGIPAGHVFVLLDYNLTYCFALFSGSVFSAFCWIVCNVSISCNVFSVFYLIVCYVSISCNVFLFVFCLTVFHVRVSRTVSYVFCFVVCRLSLNTLFRMCSVWFFVAFVSLSLFFFCVLFDCLSR